MELRAGPVRVHYESGFLRHLRVGGEEIVRMIYFAVRDRNWNTIPGTIQAEKIFRAEDSFTIRYAFHVAAGEIQMHWEVAIEGLPDGTISYAVLGMALSTFPKNRLGICVLHPVEGVAGQPCRITHPTGEHIEAHFPEYISPHQPFKSICSMQWTSVRKESFRLDFEGEMFETEDQRNWTDASFKTYGTPLELPFPVEIRSGTQVEQKVIFRVEGLVPVMASDPERPISIETAGAPVPFPAIGLGLNAEGTEPTAEEKVFLQSLGLSHLRANAFLDQTNWATALTRDLQQSKTLQIPLQLALFFGKKPEAELAGLLPTLQRSIPQLKTLLVFEKTTRLTTQGLLEKIVLPLRQAFKHIPIGGGTDANFAEFNRSTADFSPVDFISWSINPQVHAFDDLSLIENTAAQADTIRSGAHKVPGKPVHISPVTLLPRFNAVATSGETSSVPPADVRQLTPFAAGWTLGSLKYLGESGASAITYFETTGERGICRGNKVFPVGDLLKFILPFRPHHILPTRCTQPLKLSPLLLQKGRNRCLLLANHTATALTVQLPTGWETYQCIGVAPRVRISPAEPARTIILAPLAVVALLSQTLP